MPVLSPEPILPRHPRWEEFVERLCGPEGCNFIEGRTVNETRWTCFGGKDKRFSHRILRDMGLSEQAIAVSLAYFEDHGGHCDCEVAFNVGYDPRRAADALER